MMYARIAVLAVCLAICQAQYGGSHSSFGPASYGGFSAGYNSGYNGYFGGHSQAYVAPVAAKVAVAPVAVAPIASVAKIITPVVKQVAHQVDYFAHPKYHFEYAVEDKHTGDVKSHHEERDGDNTRGYYTVNEPDGTILTVHYTVDKHSGFQAVVERKGHAAHPQQVKKVAVVAPVLHHAPVYHNGHY